MVEVAQVGSVVALLGECPVWSESEQVLYWEDIDGRAIHRYDPATGETDSRSLPGRPGSFVFTTIPGQLLVAMETDLVWLHWSTGETEWFVGVEDASGGNRLNDGRCDPAGRYVVGTMHPSPEESRFLGSLYSIDQTGAVSTLETEVGVPNGLVFDADRSRMYWTDTLRHVIWVWDYDLDTGLRRNKRVFFDYEAHDEVLGLPDGACLDVDGCYWSASVGGWALTRITPEGTVDRRIDLPVQRPTMPAFGGADLSTLYVTSIGDGGGSEDSSGVPAGSLLAVDAGVQGLAEPRFAS
jgi:sugar lactone lactonase YvrE